MVIVFWHMSLWQKLSYIGTGLVDLLLTLLMMLAGLFGVFMCYEICEFFSVSISPIVWSLFPVFAIMSMLNWDVSWSSVISRYNQ